MNSQTPRAGDRAIIIREQKGYYTDPNALLCPEFKNHRRAIFDVMSSAVVPNHKSDWPEGVLINKLKAPCGCVGWCITSNLLRIPPDSEAKQLFTEIKQPERIK